MTAEGRAPNEVLKVGATSKPVLVAGAIAGVIRSQSRVEVHAIGAGAVNQAIKAIAISRSYVAPGGLDLAEEATAERRACRAHAFGGVPALAPVGSRSGPLRPPGSSE